MKQITKYKELKTNYLYKESNEIYLIINKDDTRASFEIINPRTPFSTGWVYPKDFKELDEDIFELGPKKEFPEYFI